MGARGYQQQRCAVCGLPSGLCGCAELPRLASATSLLLLTHAHDARRPSNTARLLLRCLNNCEQVLFGARDRAQHPPRPPHLVLHPDGRPLCSADARPGLRITVPDGSWSQVRHMLARVPALRSGELVSVASPSEPLPSLRRAPQPGYMCTFVAVAQALGVLEGDALRDALLAIYGDVVGRWLKQRNGAA